MKSPVWYDDDKYWKKIPHSEFGHDTEPNLEAIVAEAERRGAERSAIDYRKVGFIKACRLFDAYLEEMKASLERRGLFDDGTIQEIQDVVEQMASKEENPVLEPPPIHSGIPWPVLEESE